MRRWICDVPSSARVSALVRQHRMSNLTELKDLGVTARKRSVSMRCDAYANSSPVQLLQWHLGVETNATQH